MVDKVTDTVLNTVNSLALELQQQLESNQELVENYLKITLVEITMDNKKILVPLGKVIITIDSRITKEDQKATVNLRPRAISTRKYNGK